MHQRGSTHSVIGTFFSTCHAALSLSVVLNEGINGLPMHKGVWSMSRLQADFSGDDYWGKAPWDITAEETNG